MTTSTWVTMVAIMALVWGGCAVALVAAMRKESQKARSGPNVEGGQGPGEPEDLPVMLYDWEDESIRGIADNIWHAQMAGWPQVLTYVHRSRRTKRGVRRESLRQVPGIESRDEYPFASTEENEGSVWVGHASVAQQNAQRDLMNRFYRENGAYSGGAQFRFEVKVVNHPKGAVTVSAGSPRQDDIR